MCNARCRHRHSRCPRAQSAGRRSHAAAQPADLHDRRQRVGQEFAGVRHAVCRGAAAVRRIALELRPAVSGADAQARCRFHHRAGPVDLDSAESDGRNPRSTVGTITEIYDYLRVLFARVGQGHCPKCGRPITAQIDRADPRAASRRCRTERSSRSWRRSFSSRRASSATCSTICSSRGFCGHASMAKSCTLTDDLQLDRQMRHTIEVVVDRLTAGKDKPHTTGRSRRNGDCGLSGGTLIVAVERTERGRHERSERGRGDRRMDASHASHSQRRLRPDDQLYCASTPARTAASAYEPPSPAVVQLQQSAGHVPGLQRSGDAARVSARPADRRRQAKSIAKGRIEPAGLVPARSAAGDGTSTRASRGPSSRIWQLEEDSLLKTPWKDSAGGGPEAVSVRDRATGTSRSPGEHSGGVWKHGGTWDGFLPELLDSYRKAKNPMRRRQLEKYMEFVRCSACEGQRLNPQARNVRITSKTERPGNSEAGHSTLNVQHSTLDTVSARSLRPVDR